MKHETAGTPPSKAHDYEIRLKGHLEARWVKWFDGLTITLEENGNTLLSGPVADQAALHGLLKKVRDLGLPLLAVNTVEPGTKEERQTQVITHLDPQDSAS
jgi:hypothetical protein